MNRADLATAPPAECPASGNREFEPRHSKRVEAADEAPEGGGRARPQGTKHPSPAVCAFGEERKAWISGQGAGRQVWNRTAPGRGRRGR